MKTPSSARALAGEAKATYLLLDLLKRRAPLLGLDMPAKRKLSGPEGGPLPLTSGRLSAGGRRAHRIVVPCSHGLSVTVSSPTSMYSVSPSW